MIKWCLKYWKFGIPLLLIPLAIIVKSFGWVGDLLHSSPRDVSGSRPIVFDPQKSEEERERIIDEREAAEEKIVTEADRERRDIDSWIDEGLNK